MLFQFPLPIHRQAVLVSSEPDQQQSVSAGDLLLLKVPAINQETAELLGNVREWVDAAAAENHSPSHLLTFQGAQIFWSDRRVAVLAPADRLESISTALIEVSYYDQELHDIERTLGENWPQLEADMTLAFEFDQGSISKRPQLLQRFRQIHRIRARLAQIAPHVYCPHVHPPTLASQIRERLRERTRMVHRHEYLDEQIEVFENVYEMCGQRTSDFMLTRSGNTLEWAIIVLLFVQILLSGFEILTSIGQ